MNIGLLCVICGLLASSGCGHGGSGGNRVSYREDVRTVLLGACRCHVDNLTPPGGLDLTHYESLMKGSASGRQVVAAHPESSNLYRRVSRGEMPPTSPLAPEDIRTIGKWIEQGAKNN